MSSTRRVRKDAKGLHIVWEGRKFYAPARTKAQEYNEVRTSVSYSHGAQNSERTVQPSRYTPNGWWSEYWTTSDPPKAAANTSRVQKLRKHNFYVTVSDGSDRRGNQKDNRYIKVSMSSAATLTFEQWDDLVAEVERVRAEISVDYVKRQLEADLLIAAEIDKIRQQYVSDENDLSELVD